MTQNLQNRKDVFSLTNIQNKFNNLFEDLFSGMPFSHNIPPITQFPAINVSETKEKVVIKAELAAVSKADVKIDINKDKIIISGEKKDESKHEDETFHLYEISYGKFQRIVNLGFDIDPEKTQASFEQGVLVINVKKPEKKETMKRIPIQ